MINFLKKQFFKIVIYIVILVLLNGLWFFSEWNIFVLGTFNSLITSLFTFIIGKTWVEDYKLEINKELEEYKTKLSSYTLVTKLQYDLEFKIYTEIYEKIFQLYIETDKLKPILDIQTTKEDMEVRLKEFANIYNITSKVINQYRPFYSERIYNLLIFIRNMCCEDAMDVRCSLDSTKKIKFDYKKSKEIKEDIKNKLNELSDLIRQRIENMKIIEN